MTKEDLMRDIQYLPHEDVSVSGEKIKYRYFCGSPYPCKIVSDKPVIFYAEKDINENDLYYCDFNDRYRPDSFCWSCKRCVDKHYDGNENLLFTLGDYRRWLLGND